MIHAYSESYLDETMPSLGEMLDYAVNDCGYDADTFWLWFIHSGIAERFGAGHPKFVAGMSGIELATEIVYLTTGTRPDQTASQHEDKSVAYWAGWSLAYYQWFTGMRFKDIFQGGLTPSVVMGMYILHEADESKFVEEANAVLRKMATAHPSRLHAIRKSRGMTQKELSDKSGVALRMIQLYEQQRNDINNAAISTVMRLASTLGCDVQDILEPSIP